MFRHPHAKLTHFARCFFIGLGSPNDGGRSRILAPVVLLDIAQQVWVALREQFTCLRHKTIHNPPSGFFQQSGLWITQSGSSTIALGKANCSGGEEPFYFTYINIHTQYAAWGNVDAIRKLMHLLCQLSGSMFIRQLNQAQ